MPILKSIANVLTIFRLVIGFIIASIGNIQKKLGTKKRHIMAYPCLDY